MNYVYETEPTQNPLYEKLRNVAIGAGLLVSLAVSVAALAETAEQPVSPQGVTEVTTTTTIGE